MPKSDAQLKNPAPEPSDETLLQGVLAGDPQAAQLLFDRYQPRLVEKGCAYLPSRDLAQDVAQEVFLKLLESPPRELADGSLRPWLLRVTRNLALDRARRGRHEIASGGGGDLEMSPYAPQGHEPDPLAALMRSNDAERIRSLWGQLPPELQRVLEARFERGLSFQEIALQEGIPLGTALWRGHHAFKLLRQKWSAES
ncbi:MAG: RNA polymerase sigma factor [Oligosphaeraceae bacterium]